MIVLYHGNTYKEITCDNCKAILGYTEKDIDTRVSKATIGNTVVSKTYESYVVCPECKRKITVNITQEDC